ncbi:lysophospholipid acyltransferase family protein [Cognatishimia sp. SS12]|uniref:lysophospholipid acyltransferase family protein n=1 Tax=Cognatishimia sp. SS12 TaxID=2979465 RepID=UPI00232A81B1|nr:lysophospholipid acyltransferase family protein [Cognatishimia sp. SS12]MDC0739062.1 lysophospholipid acyltransferase family protein [Cognatishimia sp. SS12]
MMLTLQWIRSLVFIIQMYVMMLLMGLFFFIPALLSRRAAIFGMRSYCAWVRWTLSWMVGLTTEVRGPVPEGAVLIAAKHQSFLDIILLMGSLPSGRFIMKRELMYAPILGQYALRIGCVPVNRGKRGKAIKKMAEDVRRGATTPGQLIIYPQGTRIAPGVKAPYKVGTFVLYDQLQQPCVPAATNVGVFWPKRGILRKPGHAVMEFLPPLAPGLDQASFMSQIEDVVERNSNALMREAGFDPEASARTPA